MVIIYILYCHSNCNIVEKSLLLPPGLILHFSALPSPGGRHGIGKHFVIEWEAILMNRRFRPLSLFPTVGLSSSVDLLRSKPSCTSSPVANTQLYPTAALLSTNLLLVNQPPRAVQAYSREHGSSVEVEEHLYGERIATSGGSARRG